MRIAVLVKQVPETRSVRMDEATGTVIRHGNEAIVNPLDLYAVHLALQWKRLVPGATATAVSMGPPSAVKVLREALALGVDDALLVSDAAYAGSDTYATAKILGAALRYAGGFDVVMTGERATDGDTGQVGPELAAELGATLATFVDAAAPGENSCRVERSTEHGVETIDLDFPAVLCVTKAIGEAGLPTLAGFRAARRREIPAAGQKELQIPADWIGLAGSPTRVVKIFRPALARQCRKLAAADPAALRSAVDELALFLGGAR